MDHIENQDSERSEQYNDDNSYPSLYRQMHGNEQDREVRNHDSRPSSYLDDLYQSGSTLQTSNSAKGSTSDIVTYRHGTDPRYLTIQIKQLCTSSVVSSTLFPRPEALSLRLSYRGRWIVAVNSSRIVVFDIQEVSEANARAFAVSKRPIAFDIHDDGSLLAVLTRSHQVSIYQLPLSSHESVRFIRAISLDLPCKDAIISPDGMLFAAIHESGDGLEFVSLASNLATIDRRLVACKGVDTGIFSMDSRTFVAASTSVGSSSTTTIFSVHCPDEAFTISEDSEPENSDKAWIRTLLFPQVIDSTSHAAIVPDPNTKFIDELLLYRYGTDELAIIDIKLGMLSTKTLSLKHMEMMEQKFTMTDVAPAVSIDGDMIAVVLENHTSQEIWVYKLPTELDEKRLQTTRCSMDQTGNPSALIEPKWKISLSTMNTCHIEAISDIRWISIASTRQSPCSLKRLLAVGRCVNVDSHPQEIAAKPMAPEANIVTIDFDADVECISVGTIQLENIITIETLHTQKLGLEQEVELVRRRTTAQKKVPTLPSTRRQGNDLHRNSNRMSAVQSQSYSERISDGTTGMDEPYSHSQPRPVSSLQRAATVAAVAPPQRRHLQALPGYNLEYRRADGRSDMFIPHESDADNWVPPPPPYTPEPDTQSGVSRVAASPIRLQALDHAHDVTPISTVRIPQISTQRQGLQSYSSVGTVQRPTQGLSIRSGSATVQRMSPVTISQLPDTPHANHERSVYEENSSRFLRPSVQMHLAAFSAEDLRIPPDVDSSDLQQPFGTTQRDFQRVNSWRSRNNQSDRHLFLRRSQTYSTDSDVRPPRRYSLQNDEIDMTTRNKVSTALKNSCVLM